MISSIRNLEVVSKIGGYLSYLRTTPKEIIFKDLKFRILVRLLPKQEVDNYITFILELVGADANFRTVIDTLSDKLEETYPNKSEKYLVKFFYKTVKQRFASSKDAQIYYALEPFLDEKEKMIFSAAPTALDSLEIIQQSSASDGKLKATVIKAAIAPVAYFALMVAIANLSQVYMIETFIDVFTKLKLEVPFSIGLMNDVNNLIISFQWTYAPLGIATIATYRYFIPNLYGHPRQLIEKIPVIRIPFTLSRSINAGLFLTAMSLLYRNGVNTKRALKIMNKEATPFVSYHLQQMIEVHGATGSDTRAMRNNLFDRETQHHLNVFFSVADPTIHMERISKSIMTKIEERVTKIAKLVNGIGLGLFAIYLTLFALSMNELAALG